MSSQHKASFAAYVGAAALAGFVCVQGLSTGTFSDLEHPGQAAQRFFQVRLGTQVTADSTVLRGSTLTRLTPSQPTVSGGQSATATPASPETPTRPAGGSPSAPTHRGATKSHPGSTPKAHKTAPKSPSKPSPSKPSPPKGQSGGPAGKPGSPSTPAPIVGVQPPSASTGAAPGNGTTNGNGNNNGNGNGKTGTDKGKGNGGVPPGQAKKVSTVPTPAQTASTPRDSPYLQIRWSYLPGSESASPLLTTPMTTSQSVPAPSDSEPTSGPADSEQVAGTTAGGKHADLVGQARADYAHLLNAARAGYARLVQRAHAEYVAQKRQAHAERVDHATQVRAEHASPKHVGVAKATRPTVGRHVEVGHQAPGRHLAATTHSERKPVDLVKVVGRHVDHPRGALDSHGRGRSEHSHGQAQAHGHSAQAHAEHAAGGRHKAEGHDSHGKH